MNYPNNLVSVETIQQTAQWVQTQGPHIIARFVPIGLGISHTYRLYVGLLETGASIQGLAVLASPKQKKTPLFLGRFLYFITVF